MPQPFDYRLNVPDPTKAILEGVAISQGLTAQRQAQQAADQAAQRKAKLDKLLTDMGSNPSSEQIFEASKFLDPKQTEIMLKARDLKTQEEQDSDLTFTGQVISALRSDKPKFGIDLLLERAEAERNDGNEEQAKAWETWAKLVEANPKDISNIMAMMAASLGKDGQDMISGLTAFKKAPAELKKTAAETAKLEAEADLLIKELEAVDTGVPSETIFKQEEIVKKRHEKEAVIFRDAKENLNKFQSAYDKSVEISKKVESGELTEEEAGPADISMIIMYMKMVDPGSTVREGEVATIKNAAGVDARARNIWNSMVHGAKLTPEQRNTLLSLSKDFSKSSEQRMNESRERQMQTIEDFGLSADRIFGTTEKTTPTGETTTTGSERSYMVHSKKK